MRSYQIVALGAGMLPRKSIQLLLIATALAACSDESTGPPEIGVDEVTVGPRGYNLLVGESVQLSAAARRKVRCDIDFCYYDTVQVPIRWTSSHPGVATVSSDGTVRGVAPGWTTITATADGQLDTARVRVAGRFVPVESVTAGVTHSCGLDGQGAAYCWGDIWFQTSDLELEFLPRHVAGGLAFTSISSGTANVCALTASGEGYCWGAGILGIVTGWTDVPRPVAGGLRFASITPGLTPSFSLLGSFTCALAKSGQAYCWGYNDAGQLGTNSAADICTQEGQDLPCSSVPVPAAGDLRFASLSAGRRHVCGLTTAGQAFCWGANEWGQLGAGHTTTTNAPVMVATDLIFASVAAGLDHTCALAETGAAYCWGRNDQGQLGTGTADDRPHTVPVAVSGALKFEVLDAGGFSCGLVAGGQLHCWGQPGASPPAIPTPVPGGLTFSSFSVGAEHACAVPPSGRPHCWGSNSYGRLGSLTSGLDWLTPAPIAGPVER